ncbi:TldD/PmbA family protein [Candidatus Margulisiibacteriota bacterium]
MLNKINFALGKAMAMGVDQAEIFASRIISTRVNVRDQQVEEVKQSEDMGLSVRIVNDHSLGFTFTSELTTPGLEKAVENALAVSKFTAPDENNTVAITHPEEPVPVESLQLYDEEIAKLELPDKIDTARRIEQAARQHRHINKTEIVSYTDHIYELFLVNSKGFQGKYKGTYCGGTADVIAESGHATAETGFGIDFTTSYQDLDPLAIGKEAAANGSQMLEAETVQTQTLDIVFSPLVAIDFLEVLSPMFLADQVLKGRSLLAGKESAPIASDKITIIDSQIMPKNIGSAPFDAEGTPAKENIIVENGVLNQFLYDNYNANKSGKVSTGNASRGSFMSLPSVGTSNIYFKPGKKSEAEIIGGISNGFYITRLLGMHTANPVSGDFSLGASGLLIKNGQLSSAVRGVAIAGNLVQLLKNVVEVGNNLRFIMGTGAPTIHLGELTVSGN